MSVKMTCMCICDNDNVSYHILSCGQRSSLLWTHTLRPFYSRPIALSQEGRSLVNDVLVHSFELPNGIAVFTTLLVSSNCHFCMYCCLKDFLQCFDTVGHQEEHAACKIEWWDAGVVVCLQRGANGCIWYCWCHYHPIIIKITKINVIKIQNHLNFLVKDYPGYLGKESIKHLSVLLEVHGKQTEQSSLI